MKCIIIVHFIIILYLPANVPSTQNVHVFRSTKPDSMLEQTLDQYFKLKATITAAAAIKMIHPHLMYGSSGSFTSRGLCCTNRNSLS